MAQYRCAMCGYVHDETEQGGKWADLPATWVCPVCSAAKSSFSLAASGGRRTGSLTPGWFVRYHRVFGYVFLALYVYFLWQMIPRLWMYQIEFPARTVAHVTLGMAIGAILVLKILIVRFFRRLDAALVPAMGVSLAVGSVVLIGISAPFAFQEALMRRAAASEGLSATENLQRVRALLIQSGVEEDQADQLASPETMRMGRDVLRRGCVECHDLRTVLARPRTPENWLQTVRRMADRTTSLNPLGEDDQLHVTAYLIAISPQLQQSTQKLRNEQELQLQSKQAVEEATQGDTQQIVFDEQRAKQLFETKCSECHEPQLVQSFPPRSPEDAQSLVSRMVNEGLTGTTDELSLIIEYLTRTFVAAEAE